MLQDLRYALRFLARRRGFTLVAVLTLALGVGVNAAIFSVADTVLFRPLPYAHRDRLFVLEPVQLSTGRHRGTLPVEDLATARAAGVFDAAIELDYVTSIFIRDGDRLQSWRAQPVPPGYLDALGVSALYGRDFRADDGDAAMLTYRTWVTRFGADPSTLGTVIHTVDGRSLQVIGVLPPSFRTASATAFFTPPDMLLMHVEEFKAGTRAATPIVRLAAGVTADAAAARIAGIHGTEIRPGDVELRLVPLREVMGRTSSRTLTLLCAVAILVLMVGCANLANLVLARGAERERELAVRASLGASRGRIVRLLVVENLAIAALGGAAGVAVAYWSYRALVAALPASLARSAAPVFDARVFVFAAGAALFAGLASSVWPAWRLARADLKSGIDSGRTHTHSARSGPKALLALEVGFAVVSVVAAVMLAQSLFGLLKRELGFDARRLVVSARTVGVRPPSRDRAADFAEYAQELDAIRALPGIRSSAATMSPPGFGGAPDVSFPAGPGKGGGWIVSAGFFRTMGVKLIAGREFDDREGFSGAPVAVLNQAAARLLFGDGEAVGREVRAPKQPARTVVGVVADARQSFKTAAEPAMYVPFDRSTFRFADTIVDADDTPALREQIRRAILRVSRDSDVAIEPLAALLDRDVAVLRFSMRVIAAFAVLTVLLAMLGVYGVITFIAGERLREYGVRVALGASRQAIATLVLRHAVVPIGAGVIAGLVVSAWAARLLAAEILDVSPASLVTFLIASSALLVCGVLAASVPARRATRVDPMIVLRAE